MSSDNTDRVMQDLKQAVAKKLKAVWSDEADQDLRAMHGVDVLSWLERQDNVSNIEVAKDFTLVSFEYTPPAGAEHITMDFRVTEDGAQLIAPMSEESVPDSEEI